MAERLFVVIAENASEAPALRRSHLQAHLEFVEANLARYRIAGPLLAQAKMHASVLIIEAENAEDARAFLANDPYVRDGVYASIRIEEFRAAAGTWIGGKTW